MAEVLGARTILTKALPTGTDGTLVAQWRLRDSRTYGEIIADVARAVGAFNQQMVNDWGWCFGITEELMMEYEDGGSVGPAKEITDTDKVDATHGTTLGHMIALHVYAEAIGGTKRAFRDLREAQFMADIRTHVRKHQWRFEQELLKRWFQTTEHAVGTGYNVPFVHGTGGNVDWAPPAYGGEAFTTSHDHYLGVDDDTLGFDDVLNQLAETVQEHGHEPPYTALVSRADLGDYLGLTKFVEVVDPVINMIDRGGATSGATFFAPGQRPFGLLGYYQSNFGLIEVRYSARIPTKYAGLMKSYGQNDVRNGLAVRVHPDEGFGVRVVPEMTDDNQYPIKQVNDEFEFGVGVGMDRSNGAAAFLDASGNWSDPTIS